MIKVRVPATSANLGPGFDVLGMALAMHNFFSIEEIESGVKIEILPDNDSGLAINERNLAYKSAIRLFDEVGYKCSGLHVIIENGVPVGRGLGSSSTAIVGGLIAANELCGKPLKKDEIFKLATEIEGHPDNVAPAIYGGFTICYENETGFKAVSQVPASSIKPVMIIPGTKLETRKARGVLPNKLSMKDAIFNISRTALITSAIINGDSGLLKNAMEDRVHQPYRAPLIPGLMDIITEVSKIPGTGVALSGAGPSILCLISRDDEQNTVDAIEGAVRRLGFDYRVVSAEFDFNGAFLETI